MSRHVLSLPMFAVAILALGGIPAFAASPPTIPDWVDAYTREALAAPVTLDNAQRYRWYQIGAAIRAQHPMVYDIDIRPMQEQLRRHGNAAVGDLKQRLDERFAAIRSLEEAGPFLGRCDWIMARERGEGATQLQIDLDAHCRERALPALYVRLVRKRAEALDVRLATMRRFDVGYPGHLVGSPGFVGRADVAGAYARALEDRLTTAQPQVIADLTEGFRTKTIGDDPLQTDVAQCHDLLGPWFPQRDPVRDMMLSDPLRSAGAGTEAALRFGQAVGSACRREAKAWLMRQQPGIDAAIRASITALDPKLGPILAVGTRCSGVLGRWFTASDGFDLTLTGPLHQTCREQAQGLNARAVDIRAQALAARFAAAPKTLDGLERNGWFAVSADELQAAHDPRDPERGEVDALMQARTEALVQPLREAAREAALTEIRDLFERAGLGDAELQPARRICSPYVGGTTRTLPPGGADLRKAISDACREQENRVAVRRAEAAVATAEIEPVLGEARLVLSAPDGRQTYADPRAVVIAAAGNGLQISFRRTTSWFFWTTETLRVTPFGRDNPALVGHLVADTHPAGGQVWRVTDLQALPSLDGPFATLACLTQGPEAAQALAGLGLAGMASIFLLDLPRTGVELLSAAGTLTTSMGQCADARRSYFALPGPGAS
ncbi:hypothetical protein MKK50_13645 [Methylobacterium sp. J-043]|nr:hypothetical protein [Methylobacterium sp. J-043]